MNHAGTTDPTPGDDLLPLSQAYCDGKLAPEDQHRLEELLRGRAENQRRFLHYVDLHARLCWEARRAEPSGPTAPAPIERPLPRSRSMSAVAWAVTWTAASLAALWILTGVWWSGSRPVETPTPLTEPAPLLAEANLATVLKAVGRWGDQLETIRPGQELGAGVIDLPQGIMELECPSGVHLIVESPARLELVDASRIFLHSGRLVARVPTSAVGFVIDTTQARVVDLGTEFGVAARQDGTTQVQVYEGEVDTHLRRPDGEHAPSDRLKSGEARTLDAGAHPLPFVQERFLRSFPKFPTHDGNELPFNRSERESVHVRRVTTAPTIDGDLSDWDRAGMFQTRCLPPYAESYYVEGMLSYDDQRLHVALHVGDPAPMRSMADPRQDPAYFWTGGGVLFRTAANDTFGWPLNAAQPRSHIHGRKHEHAKDLSDQIVHMGMWYSLPQESPRLMLQYGMDCHGQTLASDGWQGAFRKDADGRGYTLEYSIDYARLHASPPRPGDVWPATLTVHWSDQAGRTCMGQLVEITNQSQGPFRTFDAATWGKILFDP